LGSLRQRLGLGVRGFQAKRNLLDKWSWAVVEVCPENMITLNSISRRQFVKASMLAATALGMKPYMMAHAAASTKPPSISVQLYSVRDDCAKDFDGTLAQLAKMGFVGVEFAGYHKYQGKAKELRQKLDELNLKAAATHIGTGSFRGEELKRTIEFHQILGCKFLIVPGDGDFTNHEKSKTLAETFNQTAEALKPVGMYCGYHNHTHEFTKDGDKTYWICLPSAPAKMSSCSRTAVGPPPPAITRSTSSSATPGEPR